jgi:hypothetical protein
MSNTPAEVQDAQFAYVSAYVRQFDPSATDAAISRYLVEIETMATALNSLDAPDVTHIEPFTPVWPDGEDA